MVIDNTALTPDVNFDPKAGKFEISGYSRPEDVREFYSPLIKYFDEFQKKYENRSLNELCKTNDLLFIFKFTYFNSASTKFLSDLLFQIMKFKGLGINFEIDWYYEEYDEDMREVGEDLSDMVGHPFNFYSFRTEY